MAVLVVLGLVAAMQMDGLPGLPGDDDPGAVTLPEDLDPDARTFPDPADATDSEGNPRCHDATTVIDCVTWAVRIPDGDIRFAHPLGAGQLLVFSAPNVLGLLDLDERAIRWTYETDQGLGPMVTEAGMLVMDDDRTLTGVDLTTGEVRWQRDDLHSESRPEAQLPLQLLTSAEPPGVFAEVAGPEQDRVLRIDATDGTTRWEQPLDPSEHLLNVGGSLLAATQQPMFQGTDVAAAPSRPPATVRALDLDTGVTLWRAQGQPVLASITATPRGASRSSPLVLIDEGTVRLMDPTTGAVLLEVPGLAAATSDDMLVVRRDGWRITAYGLDGDDAAWTSTLADVASGGPGVGDLQIVGEHVLARSRNSGSRDTMLALLDLGTGEVRYRFDRGDGASMARPDGEVATIRTANLAGLTIDDRTLAVVHQRGPERILWMIDLVDQQLAQARVDEQRQQPRLADDVVVLLGEPAPTLRHRDSLDRAWRLTDESLSVISTDPLLVGAGDVLYAIELPASSP